MHSFVFRSRRRFLFLRLGLFPVSCRHAGQFPQLRFNVARGSGIVLQEIARRFTSLTDPLAFIGIPGA